MGSAGSSPPRLLAIDLAHGLSTAASERGDSAGCVTSEQGRGLRGAGRRGAFRQRLRRLPSAGRARRERRRDYPALTQNKTLASADYLERLLLSGQRAMPPVGQMMSDQQVADVINYVRTHFGNAYDDAVSPADVEAARRQTGSAP